jgi:hypothetical protein
VSCASGRGVRLAMVQAPVAKKCQLHHLSLHLVSRGVCRSAEKTRNLELPHRPDGIMTIEVGGEVRISDELTVYLEASERIAVEAERSRKGFADLREVLPDLLRHYDRAWYFCGAGAYDAVSKERAKLPPQEQRRIQVFRLLPNWWEWKQRGEKTVR